MRIKTLGIIATALLLVAGISCKAKKVEITPELASSVEQLYSLGQEYIKKDPDRARLYFRQIIDSFPKHIYAQRAKLAIADSYFNRGDEANMILAAAEYREFISLFPYSPSAPYAQYQIAMAAFKKKLKPGKDQTKTELALLEFKNLITNYPLSDEAKDAREKIKECEESLAEHFLGIAKHYFKVRAYKACVSRLNDILSDYLEFSKMDQVYFYLGASHYYSKMYPESIPYFTKLITDYPQSKYVKKAQKKIKEAQALANKKSG